MSKRRFFQLHLSTAVVLMLIAGVLVWANVKERELDLENWAKLSEKFPFQWWPKPTQLGWPFTWEIHDRTNPGYPMRIWSVEELLYNTLIALAILLAVWQVCERLTARRQEADGTQQE